ncbi:hypothetical protein [Chitinimonas sp. BJB300]|uniref:hypothetical protein n=1 Tax=Chitinimonas sp. BJB300 TaxID=1559339 RepID=UPI000C1130AD|nr:hypothetical protein [Chitinimonas sp. BJB300]PHV10829.1 hypothetical protein CSQ89_14075 [Chitinimonas sp. BJB300]TSJ87059.1 hypothetical protein FG002_015930 [Chitinimonas sp. BJB300]
MNQLNNNANKWAYEINALALKSARAAAPKRRACTDGYIPSVLRLLRSKSSEADKAAWTKRSVYMSDCDSLSKTTQAKGQPSRTRLGITIEEQPGQTERWKQGVYDPLYQAGLGRASTKTRRMPTTLDTSPPFGRKTGKAK